MTDDVNAESPDARAVREAVALLRKSFDTAQVFATRHDDATETTVAVSFGSGNTYAVLGQVEEWLDVQAAGCDCGADDDGETIDGPDDDDDSAGNR